VKNFFIFLLVTFVVIALFILYNIKNPTDSMIVRQGAQWVILDHNESK